MNSDAQIIYRVQHGWLGQPHRNRIKDFTTRADAEAFQAKWKSGGKERVALPPKCLRTRWPQF